jgi:hypothetical protein
MQDKKPTNEQGKLHGYVKIYYSSASDKVWFIGNFINGVQHGYEMSIFLARKGESLETYYAR